MSRIEAGLFSGTVIHRRHVPHKHFFNYKIDLNCLPIEGSESEINHRIREQGLKGHFRRKDYFGNKKQNLAKSVIEVANNLSEKNNAGKKISGEVTLFGQLSRFSFYFSPVNFYLISKEGKVTHLLAEVTNTPWGEKHCYLVDVETCESHKKTFHVSPFNPMDMTYHWKVNLNENKIRIKITCSRDQDEFDAELIMSRNRGRKKARSLTCLKIMSGIYYQAFKLFLKKTPFYSHPKSISGKT